MELARCCAHNSAPCLSLWAARLQGVQGPARPTSSPGPQFRHCKRGSWSLRCLLAPGPLVFSRKEGPRRERSWHTASCTTAGPVRCQHGHRRLCCPSQNCSHCSLLSAARPGGRLPTVFPSSPGLGHPVGDLSGSGDSSFSRSPACTVPLGRTSPRQ